MPPSRPQDPRTLKIRDEEDQIKTLGPLSQPPGGDPNESEATFFPGADATVAPGGLEAPKPKSMVRGGAALTRPPEIEPATAPGKGAQPAIAPPRPASASAASSSASSSAAGSSAPSSKAAREVPAVAPRHPTETVLRPRAEVKRKSSWVMWLFAFLVLGGIGFGVSWFLINPSSGSSAPEAANTPPTPAPSPEPTPADAEAAVEPDAAEPEVAAADGEPNAAPLPTEIAGADAAAGADVQAEVQGDALLAAAGTDGAGEAGDATTDTSAASDTQLGAAPAEDAQNVGEAAAPAPADAQPAPADAQVAAAPVAPVEVPRNPAESNRLNEAGLNARKAGDHARAMQLYQEALKLNPDSVWARYNLACELALAGRSREAFAELTTLYKLGTPESRKALAAARKDSDFDSIRDSGQFFRLTNF